ncbi:hypothetical protein ACFFR3_07380 [Nonomuraea salmonea]|jgi:hypothetical protein|uniref:Uncharacterized protein n=1 Tax=Nonomuraea salmonea TaxID=46181 RepID=A0ABV5NGA1_9ACTN
MAGDGTINDDADGDHMAGDRTTKGDMDGDDLGGATWVATKRSVAKRSVAT